MTPGRELDALVAEKVFGFPAPRDSHASTEVGYWTVDDKMFIPVPRFSTDIAAAWEVVEKLKRLGYKIGIDSSPNDKSACVVMEDDNGDWISIAVETAETLPHAICRAALKAMIK